MRKDNRKRGFTLVETVVTVGIIAALAAVVYPTVVKQFGVADPTRLQNDLKNLQSAMAAFQVNVRAFPGDLDDLTNQITTADTSLNSSTTQLVYDGTSQTPAWDGPYADFSILDDVSGTGESFLTTGYEAKILDTFVCYNGDNNTDFGHSFSGGGGTDPGCSLAGQKFLALQILGLGTCTGPNFVAANDIIDGTAEAVPENEGRLRCQTTGGTDITYYLALPIS